MVSMGVAVRATSRNWWAIQCRSQASTVASAEEGSQPRFSKHRLYWLDMVQRSLQVMQILPNCVWTLAHVFKKRCVDDHRVEPADSREATHIVGSANTKAGSDLRRGSIRSDG